MNYRQILNTVRANYKESAYEWVLDNLDDYTFFHLLYNVYEIGAIEALETVRKELDNERQTDC